MRPDPVQLDLFRAALCVALAGSLMWVAEYSLRRGWRNPVGRNLLAKTVIICCLLLISLLASLLHFSRGGLEVLFWCDLALIAAIGPVMAWRMAVFRRVGGAVARCPAGHFVSAGALYCPQCGLPVHPPGDDVLAGRG